MMQPLTIDPELKALIGALSDEEYSLLEASIVEEQRVRVPIDVWRDNGALVIVDGHNRYEIATRHNIVYTTNEMLFDNRLDVEIFMLKNQLGRRNLSDWGKGRIVDMLEPRLKEEGRRRIAESNKTRASSPTLSTIDKVGDDVAEEEVPMSLPGFEPDPEPEPEPKPHNTRDELANMVNWSAGKKASYDYVKNNAPDIWERAEAEGLSVNQAYNLTKKREKKKRELAKKKAENTAIAQKPELQQFIPTIICTSAENLPLQSDTVNLIITSPPYNLGAEHWPMGGDGRDPRDNGIGYEDAMSEGDYQEWQVKCLNEWYRVAADGASLFYNHKVRQRDGSIIHPITWLSRCEWTIRQEIIWDRGSTHNHTASLFWQHDERIYWLTKGKPALNRSVGMPTIWKEHGPVTYTWHPAPFTDKLPEMVISAVAKAGDLILDPFGGSMTTCAVAQRRGFHSIGVDVNPEYIAQAKEFYSWNSGNES